jgi:hypothetical protein
MALNFGRLWALIRFVLIRYRWLLPIRVLPVQYYWYSKYDGVGAALTFLLFSEPASFVAMQKSKKRKFRMPLGLHL